MNVKVDNNTPATASDIAKYAAAVLLAVAGIVAFYWFADSQLRWLAVLGGVVAGAVVFLTSRKGVDTREYLAESRFELRKVVWPTRQEAGRATVMIFIAVTLISLMLAGFDVVIQWGVKALLGN